MNDEPIDLSNAIGTASLEGDGTLKLVLGRNVQTRFDFHKVLRILPDNPRYQQYILHVGGIGIGERKPIPAWTT